MRSYWFSVHNQRNVMEVLAACALEKVQHVLLKGLLYKEQVHSNDERIKTIKDGKASSIRKVICSSVPGCVDLH